ncbi:hypothetical protein OAP18_00535 [Gammaproteobacteria bacterium]|nr:hypothetical protein [Gammaproteobacteria bacterium]
MKLRQLKNILNTNSSYALSLKKSYRKLNIFNRNTLDAILLTANAAAEFYRVIQGEYS